jgi:hypothetical protein
MMKHFMPVCLQARSLLAQALSRNRLDADFFKRLGYSQKFAARKS